MTQAEKLAVREVLMQILMRGGEMDIRYGDSLGTMKRRAGCFSVDIVGDGLVGYPRGLGCRRITERGKQFILDMDADICPSPKEET